MRLVCCVAGALAVLLGALLGPAWAQVTPAAAANKLHQYPDADLALGARLITEHRCTACHQRKVGGDGAAIYRPTGRINTPSALLSMVELCSTELNLGLFPEDVAAVAAVLQRDHYRFAAASAAGPAPRRAP
jgi:hypothetical protein